MRMALLIAAPPPFVPGLLEAGVSQLLGLGPFPAIGTESCIIGVHVSDDQVCGVLSPCA
jgi:hypothetical protein